MLILGINEGIDSSVVILKDGVLKFALQEERVVRTKNCFGFPFNALRFALEELNLEPKQFDAICLSNKVSPLITKKEFLASYDMVAGQSWSRRTSLRRIVPDVLKKYRKTLLANKKNRVIDGFVVQSGFEASKIRRKEHHFNHAAAAYFGLRKNSHEPHLVLTLDGGGDTACSHVYAAQGKDLKLLAETPDGNSIGNIYSRVTHLMGMTPHEHEYKLMGLSAYLKDDKYVLPIVEKFRSYLDLDPTDPLKFKCKVPEKTYAIQARLESDFKRVRFDNLAAGLQLFTEDLILRWVKAIVAKTGIKNVVAAGGVFMNVKANKRISELPEIEYFDVFPSCGDETLPFGAVWSCYSEKSKTNGDDIVFDSFYLGPDAGFDLIDTKKKYSDKLNFEEHPAIESVTAELLAKGEIVARCSGKMEFGARALGNRSILSDPGRQEVVPIINKMIKQRDFWMPFAPALNFETASDFIRIPTSLPQTRISPYMMHSFDTTERRNELVAGIHAYDKTARAQIVTKDLNPGFYKVITEFSKRSNKAVLLNTSFNQHGYPIVMGTEDAVKVMLDSSLRYLVVNNTLITKK